ncbi:MAG: protein kinase, partial [Planctomycetota bacterium]|nr:protein kinase [Planctomycetota bacterium]
QGVVHRDLKPSNILLRQEGARWVAKISDLGFAKHCQTAGMSGLTVFGDLAGSYGYMPREQITSYRYVGPAADVFALGATFYVMVTGEMIYDLSKGVSPLLLVLEGEIVPLAKRGVEVPPALAAVIERALRVDERERFANAQEMRAAFLAAAVAAGLIS